MAVEVERPRTSLSFRDFARLYRVRDWPHFLPLPLAGWWTSGAGAEALVASIVGWGFGLAYASAINHAFDDELDRASVGKNPVGTRFDRRAAVLWSIPPAVATVVTTALWSPPGLLPALIFLLAATVYSAPPRLKTVPVVGTVCNLLIALPGLFFAGRPDFAGDQLRPLIGLFAVLLLVAQLIHEVVDVRDDRAGGVSTLGTLVGLRGALGAACGLLLLLPGAMWWLARDVQTRGALTVVVAAFALAWTAMLAARILHNDAGGLRALRLRYRHATIVLGVTAFVLVNL